MNTKKRVVIISLAFIMMLCNVRAEVRQIDYPKIFQEIIVIQRQIDLFVQQGYENYQNDVDNTALVKRLPLYADQVNAIEEEIITYRDNNELSKMEKNKVAAILDVIKFLRYVGTNAKDYLEAETIEEEYLYLVDHVRTTSLVIQTLALIDLADNQ